VREAEEVERLRLAQTTARPVTGAEPPELDQPCFLSRQFQAEVRQPLAEIGEEPARIVFAFEADQVVVGLCRVACDAEWWSGSPVFAGFRAERLGITR
jgi:hypothetical protein